MGWLDEAKHIQLRPPAPGDSFQPLGMQGTMKLADFFINEGVAQAQRAGWPLLVVDDVIMWVVGLRLAEAARVTPSHQKILRLELKTPASVSPA
jgi:tRNA(Ile)-lysidine synthase